MHTYSASYHSYSIYVYSDGFQWIQKQHYIVSKSRIDQCLMAQFLGFYMFLCMKALVKCWWIKYNERPLNIFSKHIIKLSKFN